MSREKHSYLECDLPWLLEEMIQDWVEHQNDVSWDVYWSELNSQINVCEVENMISHEQANYLREHYLGMEVF